MTDDRSRAELRPAPTQPADVVYPCPQSRADNPLPFVTANVPGGRVTAYCRWCRRMHTILLGKLPAA